MTNTPRPKLLIDSMSARSAAYGLLCSVGQAHNAMKTTIGGHEAAALVAYISALESVVKSVASEILHTQPKPWEDCDCLCSRCELIREARSLIKE